jgi:hypothetical protein
MFVCQSPDIVLSKLESVILYEDVKFGEEGTTGTTVKDFLDTGNGINFAYQSFVESAEVGNPADGSVLLGDDECSVPDIQVGRPCGERMPMRTKWSRIISCE